MAVMPAVEVAETGSTKLTPGKPVRAPAMTAAVATAARLFHMTFPHSFVVS
jgi:hypothetical protein